MANNKVGFSFYPADTDRFQDIRIKRLKKDMGCVGFAVYEYILSEIYRTKGCFIVWDESTAFDAADYWGLKETTVNEVVNYCCSVGLFNKELLSSGGVLSSRSIQSRFIEMCTKAKRKNFKIPEEYDIVHEKSKIIQEESIQNSVSLPQSKVKESKEEYIYTKFYENQIEISQKDSKYIFFVDYLFGKNDLGEKLIGLLSIRDQLTFEQFNKLLEKAKLNGMKLMDIVLKMENDKKYWKSKKSLYLTMNNWIENKFIK